MTCHPTLTARQLNRAVLARQHLLDRSADDVPAVLERMAGLQAQYAPAMYVGLWSRRHGMDRPGLTGLLENRAVVQGTLMRGTIHLVTAADYWPMALALRRPLRDWWLRTHKDGPGEPELAGAADTLRAALAAGPLRQAEIDKLLGPGVRAAVGYWIELVRVPPSGTWDRRRADLYGDARDWLGPPAGTAEDGVDLLVRRYLGGFGPASRADIARWAGVPVGVVAPACERLDLVRFSDPSGTTLLDLPGAPLPDPDTPAPVRLLPVWDATLLVHARRALVLPEEYRPRVFHVRNPQSVNTVLVDGAVAGTWRYTDGHVAVDEFHPLPKAVRRELAEEAERMATLYA